MIICTKCKKEKDTISNNSIKKVTCEECRKKRYKKYYKKNKKRIAVRQKIHRAQPQVKIKIKEQSKFYAIKRKYGVTKEQFEKMIKVQKNCCAICKDEFNEANYACVDHLVINNKTIIRGLLCYWCNLALGYLKENAEVVEVVEAAYGYIKYYESRKQAS